ncbi:glycosyltransferase family 4 protein [Acanthopleuribacter pedis]|uniref:Glycosyltransferase family 4 protein n=1 Tax=Acanthopleuribacter pedis TaxID=442870 RepID=A0A8J7U5F8_9BACT|nr:glycosyltransferase family 4 protein [Acanthopleuribacter pedis]MBO1320398.1 glycosyltransferase family 4 protein [Acanthopleuribacter pedis]
MKILVFYQYYTTPKGSWSTRYYHFGKRWVEAGHEVTIVTSCYDKSDLTAEGWVSEQHIDGVKLKVINAQISNRLSFWRRVGGFIHYALFASWYAAFEKADVVLVSSGPITVGLPALISRYLGRRRLMFETRDLWPEGAIELGHLNNALMRGFAFWLTRRCYRAAHTVVPLSPDMGDHQRAHYKVKNTLVIPNGANTASFAAKRDSWQLPDWARGKHLLLYTGNLGPTNGSHLLKQVAEELARRQRDDILLVLIGKGQDSEMLMETAERLSTIKVLGLKPKEEIISWLQHATVALVPLADKPILKTSSPNKLFEALSAGTPAVQTTTGWLKTLLEDNRCGFTVSPTDPNQLIEVLETLAGDPEKRGEYAENAKQVAAREFDIYRLADRYLGGFEELMERVP